MTDALDFIHIYRNQSQVGYPLIEVLGSPFPVSDSCERNVTLGGESYVKLSFTLDTRYVIPAFSFIIYDGEIYFCREQYAPSPKGDAYVYEVKFVSFDNMLNKMICFRHVVVTDEEGTEQEWDEPQFDLNGGLGSIMQIVTDSIHSAADRYEGFFAYLLRQVETVQAELDAKEEMLTFSYDSKKITDVLSDIASKYEIDYWFEFSGTFETGYDVTLHMCTCERTDKDLLELSDEFEYQRGQLKPLRSKGLLDCSYTKEWTGAVQRLIGYGSERNITRKHTIDDDKFVAYGKRLRLRYDHSCTISGETHQHAYAVKKEDGTLTPLVVINKAGAIQLPGIYTGEESTEKFDDIYPRGFMRVVHVTHRGTDNPIYTVYTKPTEYSNGSYVDMTDAQIDAMQADPEKRLFPIEIEEGQTLSIYFHTGYLSGREFNVANKSAMMRYDSGLGKYVVDPVNGHWMGVFEIEPEGNNQDSAQIPFGTFVPRAKVSGGYEGDILSMFNMVMPKFYMDSAENELAQAIYDKGQEILNTRPEVKCEGDPEFFLTRDIFLGERIAIQSKKFFDDDTLFVSRVTQFSHSLTKPFEISFKICSAQIKGTISEIKHEIADQTTDIQGVEQSAKNLSRRAYNDTREMSEMLQTLAAEMMVVGVEKNQFSFTMGIGIVNGRYVSSVNHFSKLSITAGEIQHTQEPYIKDANNGLYSVAAQDDLHVDIHGNSINSETAVTVATGVTFIPRLEPYYVYAQLGNGTTRGNTATVILVSLTEEKYLALSQSSYGENENYLLLGTLSSEFDDFNNTAFRVFNRTNGYTQIAGGTITTEQIQDPTRSLIIDLSSNPPRILATRGAEIIGHIKFLMPNGQTKTVDEVVGEEVDKIEIGGENLYDGGDRAITATKYNANLTFDNGKNYVITIDHITDTSSTYLQWLELTDGTNVIDKIVLSDTFPKVIKWKGKGGVFGLRSARSGQGVTNVYGLMVQQGTKATDYQEYVKHLADTFLNQARAGSTDIQGGLLMTNVLQLRNQQGVVTAGMSGLSGTQQTPENVLMWGGGTYADAVHASNDPDYKKLDGTPIMYLLKKDGTSKQGIFKIGEDKVVIDVPGKGKIIIDADDGLFMQDTSGKDRIMILPDSISSAAIVPKAPDIKTRLSYNGDDSYHTGSSSVYIDIDEFNVNSYTKEHILNGNISVDIGIRRTATGYSNVSGTITLRLLKNGSVVKTLGTDTEVVTTPQGDTSEHFASTNISFSNKEESLDVGLYTLQLYIKIDYSQTEMTRYLVNDVSSYFTLKYREYYPYDAKTIVGLDGMLCATDYNHYYKVFTGGNKQFVQIAGLPTDEPTDNEKGRLWNDNGTIKIKQ